MVLVMLPNAAAPTLPLGCEKAGGVGDVEELGAYDLARAKSITSFADRYGFDKSLSVLSAQSTNGRQTGS